MNDFMSRSPSPSLRGELAFSHARTSSRNLFSDSLRSKSTGGAYAAYLVEGEVDPAPADGRYLDRVLRLGELSRHLAEQLQPGRVVEQEVLEHEQVDAEHAELAHPLGNFVGG